MAIQTLLHALEHAAHTSDRGHVYIDGEVERFKSYADIAEDSEHFARRLAGAGVRPGERIGLVLARPEAFVRAFFATMRVGAIPVPMPTAGAPPSTLEAIARACGAALIISDTSEQALRDAWARSATLRCAMTVEDIERLAPVGSGLFERPSAEDIAFLQFTSGSTTEPRGVINLQRSVTANAAAIIERARLDATTDTCVSWLPLYHDMGLVGLVIVPLLASVQAVLMPTDVFARRPGAWFSAIHRHRGSVSFAPNFAFALALRRLRQTELAQWNLSCMRLLGCGAEPLDAALLESFCEVFARESALPETALTPAYGLAEAALCVTMKQPGRRFEVEGATVLHSPSSALDAGVPSRRRRVVSCGAPLSGHQVRILKPDGCAAPERCEGEIVFCGASVAAGYFNAPDASAQRFRGDWLHTGDLGYLAGGELFVSGRQSDLIICNGRNYYPVDIETVAASAPGATAGSIAAFSIPGTRTEEVVVVVETSRASRQVILDGIAARVATELGIPVKSVVGVPRGSLPKTSSGKLQRTRVRAWYLTQQHRDEGVRYVESI